MKRIWGLLLLAALLFASCTPLAITNVKIVDDCGCACLSWETNMDAQISGSTRALQDVGYSMPSKSHRADAE